MLFRLCEEHDEILIAWAYHTTRLDSLVNLRFGRGTTKKPATQRAASSLLTPL